MPLDENTPVIVGVAQCTHRPVADDASTWTEPLSLMAEALELAFSDAAGATGTSPLIGHIDELCAVPSFVWHVGDPARVVAQRLGVDVASTRLAAPGGTTPQTMLFDAAQRIVRGELDVCAIVGAEAMRTRDLARRAAAPLDWTTSDLEPAPLYGEVPDALTDHERAVGLALPVHAYALFEHARRGELGLTAAEHRGRLGAIAERMSAVAARNPHAWIQGQRDALEIETPSATNRMISYPYTKLLTSNVVVDMGAAVVVCSLRAARDAGVDLDRVVFPQRGVSAREQWLISQRRSLGQSIAMQACVRSLFGDAERAVDAVSLVDLYSCFPIAVQMACDALGLDPVTGTPAPTVTGGMTFFGGPGNNYVTHSLAQMTEALRKAPGELGLVTALGWYASTHAWGTYSTTPPVEGFAYESAQDAVDAVALGDADDTYEGDATVESYTVAHARDGAPERAIVALRTPRGARRLAMSSDPALAADIEAADPLGATVKVGATTLSIA